MKKRFLPLFLLVSFSVFAQLDARYANGTDENPRWVQLNLFDIIGAHIQTISNGFYTKGYHEFNMDLSRLSAGTYIYQISTGGERKSKRLEVLK